MGLTGRVRMMAGPEEFTPVEVEKARAAGVKLETHYSQTAEETYLANTCGNCGTFVGSFYLHDYWYLAEDQPEALIATHAHCLECEEILM
jgi:hypothetical protein